MARDGRLFIYAREAATLLVARNPYAPFATGDQNRDASVINQDITGVFDVLIRLAADHDAYLYTSPDYHLGTMFNPDSDGDGLVNAQDIDGFVNAFVSN